MVCLRGQWTPPRRNKERFFPSMYCLVLPFTAVHCLPNYRLGGFYYLPRWYPGGKGGKRWCLPPLRIQLAVTADEIQLRFANFQVREALQSTGGALSPRARSGVSTSTHTPRTHSVAKMQVITTRTHESPNAKRPSFGVWINARTVSRSILLIECGC